MFGLNRRSVVILAVVLLCGSSLILLSETLREATVLTEETDDEAAETNEPTAQEILSASRKGRLNRIFPEEYLNKTLPELKKIAKQGPNKQKAKRAIKLLEDGRFIKR